VTEEPIVQPVVVVPRDLTILRTGISRPFGTLQRRLARSRRHLRHSQKKSFPTPTHPVITRRHPLGISDGKPATITPHSPSPHRRVPTQCRILDWDRDPLLSDLGRALGALGWIRRVE
jgi:hypothetical protein